MGQFANDRASGHGDNARERHLPEALKTVRDVNSSILKIKGAHPENNSSGTNAHVYCVVTRINPVCDGVNSDIGIEIVLIVPSPPTVELVFQLPTSRFVR
jgi:hypothetical protein